MIAARTFIGFKCLIWRLLKETTFGQSDDGSVIWAGLGIEFGFEPVIVALVVAVL